MKYVGMPLAMWLLYVTSFRKHLEKVLKYDPETAKRITGKAKKAYRKIISGLPEFEKEDQFQTNILSCAMFSAFILNLGKSHSVEAMTEYYSSSMMTAPTRWFCRMSDKGKFGEKDVIQMKKTALLKAADRNPYSWSMTFIPYDDGSGYECRFDRCGICTLMNELGISRYTPAMCHLDYDMNEAGGACRFVRKYTLASGGPYCDCGYKKK